MALQQDQPVLIVLKMVMRLENQPRLLRGAAQLVIHLGGVAELGQFQRPDAIDPGVMPRFLQAAFQGAEVGAGAGEQQHISRRLLDKHHILWRVKPWATGEAVHAAILPITGLAGGINLADRSLPNPAC